MTEPVKGWYKITQYDDKRSISIKNLVKTMGLNGYHIPT